MNNLAREFLDRVTLYLRGSYLIDPIAESKVLALFWITNRITSRSGTPSNLWHFFSATTGRAMIWRIGLEAFLAGLSKLRFPCELCLV